MATLSPVRRLILVVGGVLAMGVIVLAVLSLVDAMGRTSRQQIVPVDQRALAGKNLVIRSGVGDIDLIGTTGSEVRIQADMEYGLVRPSTDATVTPDGFRLNSHCDDWLPFTKCRVSYRIDVPEGFTVTVVATSGDITAEDLHGGVVTLTSTSGDVVVDHIRDSHLDLGSTAGDITGTGLRTAIVDAHTTAGDVDLNFEATPEIVGVSTTAGDVFIGVPNDGYQTQYKVHITTTAGDQAVDPRLEDGHSRFTITAGSTAGDVTIEPVPIG